MTDKITLMRHRIVFTRSLAEDVVHMQENDLTVENFRTRARTQLLNEWNEAANGDEVLAVLWLDEQVALLPDGEYRLKGHVHVPENEDQPADLIQTLYDNYGIGGHFTLPDIKVLVGSRTFTPVCRTCNEEYSVAGDGWDGECPNCADRTAVEEEASVE